MGVQAPELAGSPRAPLSPGEGTALVWVARECTRADLPRAPWSPWGVRPLGGCRMVSGVLHLGCLAPGVGSAEGWPHKPRPHSVLPTPSEPSDHPRALTRLPSAGCQGGGGHVSRRGSGPSSMERPFPPQAPALSPQCRAPSTSLAGALPPPDGDKAQEAQTVTSVASRPKGEGAGPWGPGRGRPPQATALARPRAAAGTGSMAPRPPRERCLR